MEQLLSGPVGPGELLWIGLRPARNAAMLAPTSAQLIARKGIAGDRYRTERDGARQVTLIAAEDLAAIASFMKRPEIPPELVRRNFVTRGINLNALKGRRILVGDVVLDVSGECAPCSQMEANLGPGGYNAVRGRGGLTARIVTGGEVKIGDVIERVDG
ncbi:MAG: MOSC domain-containing protein [Hyphomicrobium sp.]|uniref:MOSC domain-containing protein n=1 Tax=Hyphomicrobium sp. TaxID=82 RepID=UPI0039E5689D